MRKFDRGQQLTTVWLFESNESQQKKFIVPLISEEEDRSAALLIPLIKV